MQHAMVSHPSQHTRGSQPQLTIGGHPQQQIGAGQQAVGEAGGDQPTPPQKQDAEKTMTAPEVPVPPVSSVILNNGSQSHLTRGHKKVKENRFATVAIPKVILFMNALWFFVVIYVVVIMSPRYAQT
jgi:hypothetical protein